MGHTRLELKAFLFFFLFFYFSKPKNMFLRLFKRGIISSSTLKRNFRICQKYNNNISQHNITNYFERQFSTTTTKQQFSTTTTTTTNKKSETPSYLLVEEIQFKHNLLEKSLDYVHKYGFHMDAIAQAAKDMGLSHMAHGICPRGEVELIEYFLEKSNLQWSRALREENALTGLTKRERMFKIIKSRLEYQKEYINRWPEAISILLR